MNERFRLGEGQEGIDGAAQRLPDYSARAGAAPLVALSILQPWAWLIVNGFKDVENRSWGTNYRGPFWIHAGKGMDFDALAWLGANLPRLRLPSKFDKGGIVGSAFLTDCIRKHRSSWFSGPYGFVLEQARPHVLVPCRGSLKLFSLPPDVSSVLVVPEREAMR